MSEPLPSPPASQRACATWLWCGVLLLLAGCAALMVDESWSHAIGILTPPDTIQRRIIKQSYRVFHWYSYVVVAGVLLLQPIRWRLLTGYGVALGLGAGIIHGLKVLVGRARPQLELGAFHFEPLSFAEKMDAFPSGHVGGAVMISLLVGFYYPRLRWPLLFLSALVALGRIIQDRHFVSDALAGAGIAVLAVYVCYQRLGADYYPPLASLRGARASTASSSTAVDSSNDTGA